MALWKYAVFQAVLVAIIWFNPLSHDLRVQMWMAGTWVTMHMGTVIRLMAKAAMPAVEEVDERLHNLEAATR